MEVSPKITGVRAALRGLKGRIKKRGVKDG